MVARFFEWMLAPLVFVWLVSFGATFFAARASADKSHDGRLLSIATLLNTEWQESKKKGKPNQFPSVDTLRWLSASNLSPYRYAIVDSQWVRLSGDADVIEAVRHPLFSQSSADMVERSNVLIDGVVHRTIEVSVNTKEIILLAHNRADDDALVRSIVLFEAIPQAMILLMAGFLVAYGLAYVTKPLAQIQSLLAQRSADRLDPIPLAKSDLPEELEPFLNGINSLLQRLDLAMTAQRRFIADAAHQLRTPIAAMLNESQLVSRLSSPADKEAAIARLKAISERTSRLVTQLLSLARAESSSVVSTFEIVDICHLTELVALDTLSAALEKNIDFALDLQQAIWMHKADTTLIGEMVRNLIDNAFCYTPQGGQVILSVKPNAKQIVIEDSGPGIPEAQREAVLAPFFRGTSASPSNYSNGSGLGLAIVNEVALLHNATLVIDDSTLGGTRLVVSFR
jgi:two-component system, OmpR family, sensor histidine kinase TctE